MTIIYASLLIAWKVDGEAACSTDYDSAYFETYLDDSGDYRILEGNYCPGYDWSYQSTPAYAGTKDFEYSIPATPGSHSLTHPSTHSSTYSLTHSLTHLLVLIFLKMLIV
jgi:hypothetical protein